jgi:hypothetical protein
LKYRQQYVPSIDFSHQFSQEGIKLSWGDVDKKDKRGSLQGRFVQFEDGVPVVGRILDEEPHTTRVHKISQPVNKGGKVDEVFRSIPATANPDDNFILKTNGKRYPDVMQHAMRIAVYKKNEQKEDVIEIQILQGGPGIFKPLRDLYSQYGSLTKFDVSIKANGMGREREYVVTAAPVSKEVHVPALQTKMLADEAIADWKTVFPPVTAEEQQKMIKDAGFDITYDPAASIAASMTPEDAGKEVMSFGKFKGKTIAELVVIDSSYLQWAAENVTSNDRLAAACRVAVANLAAVTSGQSVAPAALPKAKETAVVEKKTANRQKLLEQVDKVFTEDPRYEDIEVMVGLVKRHSGGKTKVKDLTEKQLESLLGEIRG